MLWGVSSLFVILLSFSVIYRPNTLRFRILSAHLSSTAPDNSPLRGSNKSPQLKLVRTKFTEALLSFGNDISRKFTYGIEPNHCYADEKTLAYPCFASVLFVCAPIAIRAFATLRTDVKLAKRLSYGQLLITADTTVILGNEVLGKPSNEEEAKAMLRKLSGREHSVITGVTLRMDNRAQTFSARSVVRFTDLTEDQINYYVENYHPLDKAGAYGSNIFNRFTQFVTRYANCT